MIQSAPKVRGLFASGATYLTMRVAGQGLELVGWLLLARHLPLGSFGELSMVFLVCRYLGLVGDWGAEFRGARDVAVRTDAEVRRLIRTRQSISIALTVLCVVVCIGIDRAALSLVAVSALSRGVSRDWVALGRSERTRAAIPSVVQGVLFVVGASFVETLTTAAFVVAIAYAGNTVASVALNRVVRADDKAGVRPDAWMLLLILCSQALLSLDTLLLGWLRDAREAGMYSGVYRLSTAISTAVGIAVMAFAGDVARVHEAGDAMRKHAARNALRWGVVLGATVCALSPIAYWLVPLLFGDAFSGARGSAVLLIIAAGLMVATQPLLLVHIAARRDRAIALQYALAAGVCTAVNLLVISEFGMSGAAWTSVIAQAYLLAYMAVRLPR